MNRKNKALCAIAICAVCVVIASGAVRCSITEPVQETEQEETETSYEVSEDDPIININDSESANDNDNDTSSEIQSGFSQYLNTAWESEDGSSKLELLDGLIVLSGREGSSTLYEYELLDESSSSTECIATLSLTGNEEDKPDCILAIVEGTARTTLSCDLFNNDFFLETSEEDSIEVTGVDERLADLYGCDESFLKSAISDAVISRYPYATCASWTGEVWIDYSNDTCVTTFMLDDSSFTVITLTKASDQITVA
ncbi:MAG: hypothetical protein LUB61_04630 [Eggerthellaceae bacterium]|nr:hypothetical protein [Eggerthellaceae bacterium]